MFVDKAKIIIRAGCGGNGCTSFYTEKYIAKGGPDGGDGGKGGNIIFEADKTKSSLVDFQFSQHFRAQDGENGSGKYCHGKNGEDLIIKVPLGTVIRDEETGNIICDMFEDGQRITVLKGGEGGKGNARFKTSRRQAPRFSQGGEKTEEHSVILEFKTIADVGLLGYPNVGKSTLLSVISKAKPKIANYHFTTLSPNLGVVDFRGERFVVADIPGLIEGAGDGAGLGFDFLRHIDRTRLLVHLVDISGSEGRVPIEDYRQINKELKKYNKELTSVPQIIALSKFDMATDEEVKEFKKHVRGKKVVPICAITHQGINELLGAITDELSKLPPLEPLDYTPYEYEKPSKEGFELCRYDDGSFGVEGGLINELSRNVSIDDYDSFAYFQKQLKEKGIIKALVKAGAKDGDTIRVMDIEFEFVE